MPQPVPRIMLSAAGSGAGKTTMTAALLSALCSRGLQVQGWKCGPDYIDPMFHSHITGRPAYHADPFFLSEQPMAELVSRVSADADCAVFEGAMGFYDGIGQTDQASAYTVSQWLKIPVLLVVNPKGMGCSAAALCHGFQTFRTPNSICGILLNDIRSGMYNYYRELLERETGLPVLGYLPHLPEVQLESRHLGLMTAGEVEQLDEKIRLLGKTAAETLELSRILELAKTAPPLPDVPQYTAKPKSFRLGVAQDKAFCFTYAENLELLEQCGAELVYFSPLTDAKLPENLDGLYFCGGYPELYLPRLSGNTAFLESLRRLAGTGIPILGECGGFLYLQRSMTGKDGKSYPLAGLLPGTSRLGERLCRFGYVTLTAQQDTILGKAGTKIRAHEFHYADSTENGSAFLAQRPNGRTWQAVQTKAQIIAGFPHLYFPSNPEVPQHFADACKAYRKERLSC